MWKWAKTEGNMLKRTVKDSEKERKKERKKEIISLFIILIPNNFPSHSKKMIRMDGFPGEANQSILIR